VIEWQTIAFVWAAACVAMLMGWLVQLRTRNAGSGHFNPRRFIVFSVMASRDHALNGTIDSRLSVAGM
jgi:hypothetical protein